MITFTHRHERPMSDGKLCNQCKKNLFGLYHCARIILQDNVLELNLIVHIGQS